MTSAQTLLINVVHIIFMLEHILLYLRFFCCIFWKILNHAFVFWIITRDRLVTKDPLIQWDIPLPPQSSQLVLRLGFKTKRIFVTLKSFLSPPVEFDSLLVDHQALIGY